MRKVCKAYLGLLVWRGFPVLRDLKVFWVLKVLSAQRVPLGLQDLLVPLVRKVYQVYATA